MLNIYLSTSELVFILCYVILYWIIVSNCNIHLICCDVWNAHLDLQQPPESGKLYVFIVCVIFIKSLIENLKVIFLSYYRVAQCESVEDKGSLLSSRIIVVSYRAYLVWQMAYYHYCKRCSWFQWDAGHRSVLYSMSGYLKGSWVRQSFTVHMIEFKGTGHYRVQGNGIL